MVTLKRGGSWVSKKKTRKSKNWGEGGLGIPLCVKLHSQSITICMHLTSLPPSLTLSLHQLQAPTLIHSCIFDPLFEHLHHFTRDHPLATTHYYHPKTNWSMHPKPLLPPTPVIPDLHHHFPSFIIINSSSFHLLQSSIFSSSLRFLQQVAKKGEELTKEQGKVASASFGQWGKSATVFSQEKPRKSKQNKKGIPNSLPTAPSAAN